MYLFFLTLFCTDRTCQVPAAHSPLLRGNHLSQSLRRNSNHWCASIKCGLLLPPWSHPSSPWAPWRSTQAAGRCADPQRARGLVWQSSPNRNNGDHLGQSESLGENSHVPMGRVSHLQQWWKAKEAQRESWVRGSKEEAGTEQKSNKIEEKKKRVKVSVRAAENEVTRGSRQRRQWHPTPVLLPGKSHGQRGLVGCSPWGR